MPGKLYIVPTPIGNLKDITLRAIEVLKNVDLILAEDTRVSAKLLKHYQISKPLIAHHSHNEHKNKSILNDLITGKDIALISDAGTPAISDPGHVLVKECIANNIKIESLPGATAFVPALINSGFPTDSFVFEGFLPHKKGRKTKIESFINQTRTIILYESPHRVIKLLEELNSILGQEKKISISREITKKFEETIIGTSAELLAHFKDNEPRGEFVVCIEGNRQKKVKVNKYKQD